MSLCDMCGKETNLVVALIEGTELNVCSKCAKFGKILRRVIEEKPIEKIGRKVIKEEADEEEIIEGIVEGYGKLIKEAREKLGLKQEDFAKKINEKVSLIHNIESEHHEPSLKLAGKIEKFLKIKLIEQTKLENDKFDKMTDNQVTVGDLIKLK